MNIDSKVVVHKALRQKFPDLQVRQFEVTRLQQARWQQVNFSQLEAQTKARLAERFSEAGEDALKVPQIQAWRAAYKNCGLKASKYRSSVEQLARRMHQGSLGDGGLSLVRLYCLLSAKHMVALGAYDCDKLAAEAPGPLSLRLAEPGDHFAPLAGGAKDFPLTANVPVYAAGRAVLCWGFNHRDARPTAVDETTDRALIAGEVTEAGQAGALEAALAELGEHLTQAGAEVTAVSAGLAAAPGGAAA